RGSLPAPGQGARPKEARGHAAPDPEDPRRQGDLRADLGEWVHSRRGPTGGGAGSHPDSRVPVFGAVRRGPAQAAIGVEAAIRGGRSAMKSTRISADCHIDLPWIPPDLFTANASAAMKERMPFVTDGPDGPHWTCRNGQSFGLMNGVGPAGQKFVPGSHYR